MHPQHVDHTIPQLHSPDQKRRLPARLSGNRKLREDRRFMRRAVTPLLKDAEQQGAWFALCRLNYPTWSCKLDAFEAKRLHLVRRWVRDRTRRLAHSTPLLGIGVIAPQMIVNPFGGAKVKLVVDLLVSATPLPAYDLASAIRFAYRPAPLGARMPDGGPKVRFLSASETWAAWGSLMAQPFEPQLSPHSQQGKLARRALGQASETFAAFDPSLRWVYAGMTRNQGVVTANPMQSRLRPIPRYEARHCLFSDFPRPPDR